MGQLSFGDDVRRVHLIGIGGIGVSGMARILHAHGFDVQGSDVRESSLTRALVAEGIDVRIGHRADHLDGVDLVVLSTAIPETNPERVAAEQRGMRIVHRAEVLGEWMDTAESVAVVGTHGKGTTTALITWILTKAGRDPSFFIGAIGHNFGINARVAAGPIVAEVDESDGTLVCTRPTHVLVNNLELDHLHYYPTWDKLSGTFRQFFESNPSGKTCVLNVADAGIRQLVADLDLKGYVGFGFDAQLGSVHADVRGSDLRVEGLQSRFRVQAHGQDLGEMQVPLPGAYNASNALGAVAMALALDVPPDDIRGALATFKGLENRFTVVPVGERRIVKDYISHPTGIERVIEAARAMGDGPLWGVFKPYRFTMIHYLQDDYRDCFADADHVVITRMYTAGEVPIPGIDTPFLCRKIGETGTKVTYVEEMEDIPAFLDESVPENATVVFFGGDDLFRVADAYAASLMRRVMGEVVCPECGSRFDLPADAEAGEILDCPNCGVELDVVSLDPLEVMVFEEEEK